MTINLKTLWSQIGRRSFPGIEVGLFLFAFFFGSAYSLLWTGDAKFYQRAFGPAVMLACGNGFVEPGTQNSKAMKNFIDVKDSGVECATLENDENTGNPNFLAASHFYQQVTVAMLWKMDGAVLWQGLAPLYGLMFGLAILFSFIFIRFLSNTPIALTGSLWLVFSKAQLMFLPHLRDYSKTPFLIAISAILLWIVRRDAPSGRPWLEGSALGLIAGVAFGFRMDILLVAPPVILTIFFLIPGWSKDAFFKKGQTVAAFLLVFAAVSAPMMLAKEKGYAFWHVINLGFSSQQTKNLNIKPSPLFHIVGLYNDRYISGLTRANEKFNNRNSDIKYLSGEYNEAGKRFFWSITLATPGEALLRVYIALHRIIDYAYHHTGHTLNIAADPLRQITSFVLKAKGTFLQRPIQNGFLPLLIFLGGLCVIGVKNYRVALFVSLLTFYLAATTTLQFAERHYFYLEFLPVAAFCALVYGLGRFVMENQDRLEKVRRFGVMVSALIVCGLVGFTALWAARAAQGFQLEQAITAVGEFPTRPITLGYHQGGDEALIETRFDPFDDNSTAPDGFNAAYIKARIDFKLCPQVEMVSVTSVYQSVNDYYSMNELLGSIENSEASQETGFIYFPALKTENFSFQGVTFPAKAKECVSFELVEKFPTLALFLSVGPEWQDQRHYGVRKGL